jgi:hypothetical protein
MSAGTDTNAKIQDVVRGGVFYAVHAEVIYQEPLSEISFSEVVASQQQQNHESRRISSVGNGN